MILTRRSLLVGAAACAGARALPAQTLALTAPPILRPADMQADFDLFAQAYQVVHPGLDRYLGRSGFAARVAAAKRWATRDRSLADMYLMLARLTAAVRCGHSYPNPNNQGRAARAALYAGRDRLPLSFRWFGGRMIVTGSRGNVPGLPPGTEILSVDGEAASDLLRRMLPLARADGGNDAKRIAQLGLDPRERFAAFDVYRAASMPASTDTIALRVRKPGEGERHIELPALTEEELAATRPAAGEDLGWRFAVDGNGIGRMTMPTWTTYHTQWDWRAFIDAAVDRLIDERARGLIIDLRGNEGGTECGWHLLARIVGRDTPLPVFDRRIRYRAIPEGLRAPLDTWDDSFRDWGDQAVGPDADGWYALDKPDWDLPAVRPRGRRFAGPVAVLVDAACSSATFQFANAIRASGAARLVGEATGGNRRGINGGAYFFVRLPGSGLEVDLPIVGSFPLTREPDAGVVPHDLVAVTADDIATGRDRQLQAALDRLRRG